MLEKVATLEGGPQAELDDPHALHKVMILESDCEGGNVKALAEQRTGSDARPSATSFLLG